MARSNSDGEGCAVLFGLAALIAIGWAVWQAILWFISEWRWAWIVGGAVAVPLLAYLITVLWREEQPFEPDNRPHVWIGAVTAAAAALAFPLSLGCGWGTASVALVIGALGGGAVPIFAVLTFPRLMPPGDGVRAGLSLRLLTGLVAATLLTVGITISGDSRQPTRIASPKPSPSPTATPTPATSSSTAASTPAAPVTPSAPPSQAGKEPESAEGPSKHEETPSPAPEAPTAESTGSPGRHDGSNYDNLSPEGREAHDTLNCADVPGHKKGSCNEPNRKCNLDGATVTSSGGIRLTCRMADDGRLRWLA
ncbi:hypothetical protein ACG5V6_01060 [Streptomyces chitinivorans]|uniref:Uncharacterized protein n=1 Tax=Streptomyces chitinivorans TaxID=1257027 RepID=A0ABW7HLS6_9ACTN|nr:hypothetical protein [Streptomyces chitinivorans]MDH2408991.1 hypothetical protein [Streptomyces chitinivorans]